MRTLDCDGREVNEGDTVWACDLTGPAKVLEVYGDGRIRVDRDGCDREIPADWSLAELAPPPYGIVDPCPGCGGEGEVHTMPAPSWAVGNVNAAQVRCRCGWQGPTVPCKGGKRALDKAKRKAVELWNRRS